MKIKAGSLVAVALILFFNTQLLANQQNAFDICPAEKDDVERLECYDRFAGETTNSIVTQISSLAESANSEKRNADLVGRLTSDDPNMFTIAGSDNLDDENRLRFNLSVKYPLIEKMFSSIKQDNDSVLEKIIPNRLFLVYNGTYDFYALPTTRYHSKPVVSREQNPGAVFEWELDNIGKHRLRAGFFHHSNGQALEDNSDDLTMDVDSNIDIINDAINTRGIDYALAPLSRSWNYLQLRYQMTKDGDERPSSNWYQLQVELRKYVGDKSDDIFWESLTNRRRIQDYDGFRLLGEIEFPLFGTSFDVIARSEIKTGVSRRNAFSKITTKTSLGTRLSDSNIRISAFYFDGYGKEPSTYHLKSRYWGIGLELR